MYHNKCSVVAKQTFHTLIICVASVCAMSCGGHKSGDARTEYEQAQFIRTKDSILRLDSLSLRLCDSIMAATDDSLTYYDYYILKGRYYLLSATPDSALHYARRTRDFMEKQPSTSRTRGIKAIANSTEASFYHLLRHNPQEAIRLNTLAYRQIIDSDLKYYAPEIAANLADAYISVDNLPEGAKWYRRALLLVDSLDLPKTKNITLYMGLGQIYTSMNDFSSARYYYEMSQRQFDMMKPNMQSYFLNNYGNYFYFKHDYANALSTFRRLQKHIKDSGAGDTYDMYLCKVNLADIFLNIGQVDSAEAYVNQAADYFERNGVKIGVYYANTIRIGIALKRQDYAKVAGILASEGKVGEYNQSIKNIRSRYMRRYYEKTGNYKMAYEDQLKNIAQNDSMEHNRTHMKAAEIMMRYTEDTLKLHHQLEINEKNAEVNKSKATLWLFVSIALALASFIVCGIITLRKRKLQTRMEILTLRLNNARQRISPHFVFNVLNTRIGPTANEETDVLLRLTKLIRSSLDMTGKSWVTLREELHFIRDYIALERTLVGEDFGLTIVAPDEKTQEEVKLPAMFIQILVENAIKHGLKCIAGHKQLDISISCSDAMTYIEVDDNGPGFDIRRTDNKRTKNGLDIIRQTISIVNQENHGTAKMHFSISNREDDNGNICGCRATLRIPRNIKYI